MDYDQILALARLGVPVYYIRELGEWDTGIVTLRKKDGKPILTYYDNFWRLVSGDIYGPNKLKRIIRMYPNRFSIERPPSPGR